MGDRKAPEGWPKGVEFSTRRVAANLQMALFEAFLTIANEEERKKRVPCIDEGSVHAAIEIKEITKAMKHPLAGTSYGGRPQLGLFAKEAIAAGECLGEYVGELELFPQDARGLKEFDHAWVIQGSYSFSLNARKVANELSFVNDYRGLASEPNVEGEWVSHCGVLHLVYVTKRAIQPVEEILIDYGAGYWRHGARKKLLPSEK